MGYGGLSGMLAAFITNPFGGALLGLESAQGGVTGVSLYFWALFPSLLASAVATVVFVLLSGTFFETLYSFPKYTPRLVDMFYAAPLALIGGLVGVLFMLSLRGLQRLFQPMKERLVLRGLIGGLGMGIIGALLPLTLFSGEAETSDLILYAAQIGVVMLILLGLAKLLATSLLLATGWKGGYIFPIMFASVALGMAVNLLFPSIPVAVTVAATMAGALVAALKAPLFAALFTMILVQKETAAVIAVAVVVSALLTALLALRSARRAASKPESHRRQGNKEYTGCDMKNTTLPSNGIARFIPGLALFKGVNPALLRTEFVVAITVFAVLVPSAMAFGDLAGVTPVAGLYVALGAMVMYALFGSSKQVITGPEATSAILTATAVAPLAGGDPVRYAALAALTAILVGVIALVARLARLGFITDFLSKPILVGYIFGATLIVIGSQLGKMFGIKLESDQFFRQVAELISRLDEAHLLTVALGIAFMAALFIMRRVSRALPGPLIIVVIAIILSAVFDLQAKGVAIVGPVPAGLPSLAIPAVSFSRYPYPAARCPCPHDPHLRRRSPDGTRLRGEARPKDRR